MARRLMFRLNFRPLAEEQRLALFAELTGQPTSVDHTRILAGLAQLTPGHFANLRKRVDALLLGADAWLHELQEEYAAKATAPRRIGF